MKKCYATKTSREALTKINDLYDAFLKKHGAMPKCSLWYAMGGEKPDYTHEIVIRAENTDQMKELPLIEELYKELYE